MEIFFADRVSDGFCTLSREEAFHCFNVLRHKEGDIIYVIDGTGPLFECRIAERRKESALLQVMSASENFGARNYILNMAVAPTKNIDRFEWFIEKATEIGIDNIYPVIGEHSERKVLKPERCGRIMISAAKQSLKGAVPFMAETSAVSDFILRCAGEKEADPEIRQINMIACCIQADKSSIFQVLRRELQRVEQRKPVINIMIGPEGDFSRNEVELAVANGFVPIHLGQSRLRTETAAIVAVSSVYNFMNG